MVIEILRDMWQAIEPMVPMLVTMLVLGIALAAPLPGRGPHGKRDPWRLFKYGARREVMDRAGGRCEAQLLLMWGRCGEAATDADHIYPWSKGGPTIVSNGQALCRSHNAGKGSTTPPWWKLVGLERRRKVYFPEGADPRVFARMNQSDRALREGRAST
ncbi:HNH endonuclease [Leucobacter sp. W1478]|uniref:HNH endonuclease n=1 Tax=Leucobacter sp. W1478 TaxID=3439065 RepID=UPI003F2CBA59